MTTSDEEKLTRLLQQRRERNGADDDQTRQLEDDSVALIYRHLRDALRPLLMSRHGAAVTEQHPGTRLTELLNQFFLNVLERCPDKLAELDTKRKLRTYVARSLTNLMIDHFRHTKRERSNEDELLDCWVQECQEQLRQDCPDSEIEAVTRYLAKWTDGDGCHRRMAEILLREFLSGDQPEAIQRDLGVSKSTYYRLRHAAVSELRTALG